MCKNKEYQIPLKTVNHRAKKIYKYSFVILTICQCLWMEYNKKAIKQRISVWIYLYKPPGKILINFFYTVPKTSIIHCMIFFHYNVYDFDHFFKFPCIVGIWECLELRGRRISHVVEWYSCRDGSLRCLHPPRSYEIRGKANGGTVLTRIQGKSSKIKLCPQVVIGRFEI